MISNFLSSTVGSTLLSSTRGSPYLPVSLQTRFSEDYLSSLVDLQTRFFAGFPSPQVSLQTSYATGLWTSSATSTTGFQVFISVLVSPGSRPHCCQPPSSPPPLVS
ncbi:hypothetical protein XENOCAPTIV_025138 [Xenoophorus captivus]|uniref:Uncharacterized protein n=1 Tax=Xenoophorus captivus TaxID=1517983 RepID=A0ABV0QBK9_9TELE